jgi:DNA-3-methyladenine glycosylase II
MVPVYWERAKKELIKSDKILARIIKTYPDQTLRKKSTSFATLLRAIVGQQISVKAADSIWLRFIALTGGTRPADILRISPLQYRSVGLSSQKSQYILDLALHFENGSINPRRFRFLDDEELIKELIAVKGIGRWTAEMFLIFNLQRPDILPLQDIGLIRAIEKYYFDGERVSNAQIIEISSSWVPWRSVATWYLWRSLDPVPVEY